MNDNINKNNINKGVSVSESSFFYQPFEVAKPALMEKAVTQETVINPQKLDLSVQLIYEIR